MRRNNRGLPVDFAAVNAFCAAHGGKPVLTGAFPPQIPPAAFNPRCAAPYPNHALAAGSGSVSEHARSTSTGLTVSSKGGKAPIAQHSRGPDHERRLHIRRNCHLLSSTPLLQSRALRSPAMTCVQRWHCRLHLVQRVRAGNTTLCRSTSCVGRKKWILESGFQTMVSRAAGRHRLCS